MARVTVEDCLDNVDNRFELVMLATKRARQLATGGKEPKARTRTAKAETALADARARWQAHRSAVSTAHARLRDAVVTNRDEWLESVATDHGLELVANFVALCRNNRERD